MPVIYSDMTGPAAPEQTTVKMQCSPSHKSASLELGREKGKGDLEGHLKTKGTPRCRKLQFNNDWHSDHQDLHCTWTNRLQDSTARNKYSLYKSITYIYSHTSIYTYTYIYMYIYIHRYTHTYIHIYTHIHIFTHTHIYTCTRVYIYIHTHLFFSEL